MDLRLVREIEEVSARAWPPLASAVLDGWVLRAGGGVTGRANSVWPRAHDGALSLDDKLDAAGRFYAEHQLPLLLQVSPTSEPAGLAEELHARRYAVRRASRSVQIAQLETVARVGDPARATVTESLADDWYDVVAAVNPSFGRHGAAARALLLGVSQDSGYAAVRVDGVPVAVGRGVRDGDWLGVYNMATLPAFRRRGAAAAVLAALAGWARRAGATRAYLQMEADTDAAEQLYAGAGFSRCYEYAFWGKRD